MALALATPSCGDTGVPTTGGNPASEPATLQLVSAPDSAGPGDVIDLSARVRDAGDAPMANVAVAWAISSGTGSLSADTSVTDGSGLAEATWTLGNGDGIHTAAATVAGLAPLTFEVLVAGPVAPAPTCEDLALARGSAQPLDSVSMTGIPVQYGDSMVVEVRAAADTGYTVIAHRDSTDGWLEVPPHPAGDVGGGTVALVLRDGTNACQPLDFEIEAMPTADGTAEATVDSLQALVSLQAGFFGLTPADLRSADTDTIPQSLWPLVVAQYAIDDPDNPNSLRALLDGTAPALGELGPLNMAMLDAMLARTDILDRLGAQLGHLDPQGAPYKQTSGTGGAGIGDCMPAMIVDAAQLDDCMAYGVGAGEVLDGIGGAALAGLGQVASALSLVPGLGAAGLVVGSAAWAAQEVVKGISKMLPSTFVSIDFEVTPSEMDEDQDDLTGKVQNVKVVATNQGWTLDQDIMGALLQAGGVADAFMNPNLPLIHSVLDYLGGLASGALIDDQGNGGIVQIDPTQTPPVDITGTEWIVTDIGGDLSIAKDDDLNFHAVDIGTSTVLVQPENSKFGGAHIAGSRDATVYPIDIFFDPTDPTVSPGDGTILDLHVRHSAHPEQVTVEAEAGTATVSHVATELNSVTFNSPSDPSLYPIMLTATSTSTTGLRGKSGADPREGYALVHTDDVAITIDPQGDCLEFGSTLAFTADVTGDPQDLGVDWSVSAGTITEAGTFTAPSTRSAVTVTATSKADPGVTASTKVMVSESCACHWSVTVSGGYNATMVGDTIAFQRELTDTGEMLGFSYTMFGGTNSFHLLHAASNVPMETTGTVDGTVQGELLVSPALVVDWFTPGNPDPAAGGSIIDIIELRPRVLEAHAYGPVDIQIDADGQDTQETGGYVDIYLRADVSPFHLSLMGIPQDDFCSPDR